MKTSQLHFKLLSEHNPVESGTIYIDNLVNKRSDNAKFSLINSFKSTFNIDIDKIHKIEIHDLSFIFTTSDSREYLLNKQSNTQKLIFDLILISSNHKPIHDIDELLPKVVHDHSIIKKKVRIYKDPKYFFRILTKDQDELSISRFLENYGYDKSSVNLNNFKRLVLGVSDRLGSINSNVINLVLPKKLDNSLCSLCEYNKSNIKKHYEQVHGISYLELVKSLNSHLLDEKCLVCNDKPRVVKYNSLNSVKLLPYCDSISCKTKYSSLYRSRSSYKESTTKRRNTMKDNGTWSTVNEKRSKSLSKTLRNMSESEMTTRMSKCRCNCKTRTYNENIHYESKLEKRWLNKNKFRIDDIIDGPTIHKYNGKSNYYSDFLIKSTNTIVEVKSSYVLFKFQSVNELYSKFLKSLELGYNILFVLDTNEYSITNPTELDGLIKSLT